MNSELRESDACLEQHDVAVLVLRGLRVLPVDVHPVEPVLRHLRHDAAHKRLSEGGVSRESREGGGPHVPPSDCQQGCQLGLFRLQAVQLGIPEIFI